MQSARNDKMRINSQRHLGAAMEQAAVSFMFPPLCLPLSSPPLPTEALALSSLSLCAHSFHADRFGISCPFHVDLSLFLLILFLNDPLDALPQSVHLDLSSVFFCRGSVGTAYKQTQSCPAHTHLVVNYNQRMSSPSPSPSPSVLMCPWWSHSHC